MGTLEAHSLWGHRDGFVALSPDHLPKAATSPMLPLILVILRAGSFLPPSGGVGVGGSVWASGLISLYRCPSGLQHNRIWEIRADTFHQLTSLQAL